MTKEMEGLIREVLANVVEIVEEIDSGCVTKKWVRCELEEMEMWLRGKLVEGVEG